jgi:hypothetical protein
MRQGAICALLFERSESMARNQTEPGAESAAEEAVEKEPEYLGVTTEIPAGSNVLGVSPPSVQGTWLDPARAQLQARIDQIHAEIAAQARSEEA